MILKNISNNFYPFYTDIEEANYTKAYSIAIKVGNEYSLQDFKDHFKTIEALTDVFDNDKIEEFATDYYKYFNTILELYEYARLYLIPNREEKESEYNKYPIRNTWENTVIELYEKLRMSNSIYEDKLYNLILHDFLWEPTLDPRNPLVITSIISRIDKIKNNISSDVLDEASNMPRIANSVVLKNANFSKFDIDIDKDSNILIRKNYKADLHHYFANSVKVLKIYKDSGDVESVKKELAKLYFINELIEAKYIYNKKLTPKEKDDYPKYVSLRSQVLSTFKTYLKYVLSKEADFDIIEYYENVSPYRTVLTITQTKIKAIKALIKGIITL